jgi:predicted DNA-binding transcriptional regulator AlpA
MPDGLANSKLAAPRRHHLDKRAADIAQEGAAAGGADDLLSTIELAAWLGISVQFLEIARHKNFGPRFVRLTPRRVRYLRSSVIDWLREREHQGTAEYARASHPAAEVPDAAVPEPAPRLMRRRAPLPDARRVP